MRPAWLLVASLTTAVGAIFSEGWGGMEGSLGAGVVERGRVARLSFFAFVTTDGYSAPTLF